jgi:AhpD family alkylhydroperoxidase
MTARVNAYAVKPELTRPLIEFGRAVQAMGLEPGLLALVEIRASQINGCAVCLAMHVAEARRHGETEERIWMLDAWRETGLYTPRERAALAWTEALTRLSEPHAPDADYALVEAEFTEEERIKLTLMIAAINSFNRLGAGFRIPPLAEHVRAAA